MSIYERLRQNPEDHRVKETGDRKKSPNERLMIKCWKKYMRTQIAWDYDPTSIIMTDEINNPNFMEIVDNIKNGLPYDHIHDRTT